MNNMKRSLKVLILISMACFLMTETHVQFVSSNHSASLPQRTQQMLMLLRSQCWFVSFSMVKPFQYLGSIFHKRLNELVELLKAKLPGQWDVCKSPGFPSNRVAAGQVDPPAVRITMVCSLFACC